MKGCTNETVDRFRMDAQNVIESVSSLVMPGPWALEASYQASRFLTLLEAVDEIASWGEGDTVNGTFDEPCSAKISRDAIDKVKETLS